MRRFLAVTSFCFFAIAAATAQAQDRVALVIGNGKYIHATELPNPANDARAIAKALGEIGFTVMQGVDVDRPGMEKLLFDFLGKARDARVALLFYAGHGMQVSGRNYLVPVDARLESARDLNFGLVELDKVLSSLDDPKRANIIILDACRDNPLARRFASKTRSGAVGAGLAAYNALGTGTLIAFSTAPDKVAEDGRGANSPFTKGLIKHMRTKGLEVRQMLTRVRSDVAKETDERQVPWDNSSLRGDVYLAGLGAVATSPDLQTRPQPQVQPPSEAERAWAATKDTTSQAILARFIARFGGTVYADLARARLDEVKRSQSVSRPPPVAALPPRPAPPPAARVRPDPSYPNRLVRIIVPFGAGGSADIIARLTAQRLTEVSSQTVIVENRPGAGGIIGADAVAKASPDGYTLLMAEMSNLAITTNIGGSTRVDPRRDFAAAGLVTTGSLVLVVHSSVPARSLAEIVAYARANPGKLNYASAGVGSLQHVAAELFASQSGIRMVHVPYRGMAPALTDLVAGHVHLAFVPISVASRFISDGKLRAMGVSGSSRSSSLPSVPTIAESGLPGFEATYKYGVLAPAGTPQSVIEKLNNLLRSALASGTVRNQIARFGHDPATSTATEHQAALDHDQAKWSKVVRDAGIK
jgi:tripartite-type tricarboxylate transporter receptor subunit TctC